MLRYLPPFEKLKGLINLTTTRGKTRVDMTFEELQEMLGIVLEVVEVDEAYYLERNPDVAAGIRAGTIRSAKDHFVRHGYFEGRLPYSMKVDETWYLTQNADVAQIVGTGTYGSAQDHFDGPGYPEGRRPFRPE